MKTIKKYFSISEVANISHLPLHKLRYIEKSDHNIKIVKIRGRRYYTEENIRYIKKTYSPDPQDNTKNIHNDIICRIDKLINNFLVLAAK